MSPIRTRRARAARGGRENFLPVPAAVRNTPAKTGLDLDLKKFPGTPGSSRTVAPRKVAHRRNTIFVIERAGNSGKQRHVLADRSVQLNQAELDLKESRKTFQPLSKPNDSPDSPDTNQLEDSPSTDGLDSDAGDEEGDGERHVHWTDGIRNRAGSVVLPPRVPAHIPVLRKKARGSYPRSILQVSIYHDPLVTPRKHSVAATPYRSRGRTAQLCTPIFDFSSREQSPSPSRSGSRSPPLVIDTDFTPTGLDQQPLTADDTPRASTSALQLRRNLPRARSSNALGDPSTSSSRVYQATMIRDTSRTQQLSAASSSITPRPPVASGRWVPETVQDAIREAPSDHHTVDSESANICPGFFRLPRNRVDRCLVIFSLFYFPIAFVLLLPIVGLV
ncbi:hypothetical protein C8T65DRAFT_733839 [Cerioporus squamosus]|nr:hypothetical protein C8T65DRAFT_733839 [Cerioporus squamosus]